MNHPKIPFRLTQFFRLILILYVHVFISPPAVTPVNGF